MDFNEDPTGPPTATLADTDGKDQSSFVLETGTLLGRYVVVDRLGAGGMGTVYVAYDMQLARRVAIKVLRPDRRGEDAQARLLLEAQTMARLTHPNVLAVHDVGTFGDGVFVAMEYVEGRTLKDWLKDKHPWRETLGVLKAAGRGLEAAHAAGVVHRDFKPANVFLGNDGRVVVGDFGIARAGETVADPSARSLASLSPAAPPPVSSRPDVIAAAALSSSSLPSSIGSTETGALLGTVGYMSPERAFEHRDDARSDQFSFCVTLYRALYGQQPFAHYDLPSYLQSLLQPPRAPPANKGVPTWLYAVVRRGLSYESSERFGSMGELLAALERDPTRRRRLWALGACGAALVVIAGLSWAQHGRTLRASCRAGEALIAETWSAAAREKVGAQIIATGAPLASQFAERTQRLLDAYAVEWARVHREASEATLIRGEQSSATMKERLACLEGERDELRALVDILSRADSVDSMHALGAAYGLPTPGTCLEPAAARAASALPDAPIPRARVNALRRAVAEADALRLTDKCSEALGVATSALVEARAIPHHESEAELLMVVAACKGELEGDSAARETIEWAFAAAEAAGNDSLAAITAATVTLELADTMADTRSAERWLAIAKGIRSREGVDERADATILEGELSLLTQAGHPDLTPPLWDRLIPLLERIYGANHPRIAAAISNRAGDLDATGRPDLGVVEHKRALAMHEHLFGADVPMLSIEYNNVGWALTQLGRYPEAKPAILHSLALVAPLGADNSHNVLPLTTLATLDGRLSDYDGELAAADRGLAIVAATGDTEIRLMPALLTTRAEALLAKGDAAGAKAACARTLKLQEGWDVVGSDKSYAEDALTCLGEAEMTLGELDAAIAHLERSVSLTKRAPPTDLALARFALARALTAAKRDPARARDLAESAYADLRAAAGLDRDASAVGAWLAAAGKSR
jgi:tetratricopeptide (TPR) repeat protein/predicted Ser/Thr protein kinase